MLDRSSEPAPPLGCCAKALTAPRLNTAATGKEGRTRRTAWRAVLLKTWKIGIKRNLSFWGRVSWCDRSRTRPSCGWSDKGLERVAARHLGLGFFMRGTPAY